MMKLIPTFCAILLFTAPAFAQVDDELPGDRRIKILTYSRNDVYTVPTKYGYQTSIVFGSGEEIVTVSVGDRSTWQIVPSHNRIFIRPMDDNLTTNMTVITNQREYNFDIKSVGANGSGNLYVVQFRYPGSEPKDEPLVIASSAPAAPAATVAATSIPPLDTQRTQETNTRYSYTGADALAPADVFDDGKNTYVVYKTIPSPAPIPMVSGTSGQSAVATHRIDGNRIIINTVASSFVLTSPSGNITVYNEMFHSK